MKFLILISLFVSAIASAQTKAAPKAVDKTAQLEQRLLELESRQQAMEKWYSEYYVQGQNRVQPYLGEKISLGGYFETAMSFLSGTDMQNQSTASSQLLGINIAAEYNEKVRFVTQLLTGFSYTLSNPNNNPNVTPSSRTYGAPSLGTLVAQGYIEMVESDALILQAGLGYMPFGYTFQQRDLVLLRRRGGPQMGNSASDLVFPLWIGVHVSGSFFSEGNGRWGYNLYTFTPPTNSKSLGVGTRLWKEFSDTVTIGASFQQSQTTSDTNHSYGTDIKYSYGDAGAIFEFARTEVGAGTPTPVSYYLEPYWRFHEGKYVAYVFADYLDNPTFKVGAVADAFERWQYGGGLNWLPLPNTRFRIGYTTSKYTGNTDVINNQGRDYENVDLSAGIAF